MRHYRDEVLVVFKDVGTRDTVLGSSSMLSELHCKDTNKSTAGMRIDVPEHLRGAEKILEEYGRRVRAMHGKKTKYHIKFDDGDLTIYLSIRLDLDEYWTKVYEDNARTWVHQLRREDAERVSNRFNRPQSVGSQDVRLSCPDSVNVLGSNNSAAGSRPPWTKGNSTASKATSWTGRAGSLSSLPTS